MGMFDYIECEMPLPPTDVPPPKGAFQTKDTPDQYMTLYRISAEGHLLWKPYTIEDVPPSERPYPDDDGLKGLIGCMRRVEGPEERVPFHGDIYFYHYQSGNCGWEYCARFTDDVAVRITLVEFRAPTPPTPQEPGE